MVLKGTGLAKPQSTIGSTRPTGFLRQVNTIRSPFFSWPLIFFEFVRTPGFIDR